MITADATMRARYFPGPGRPTTVKRRNCGTGHTYAIGGHKAVGVTTALRDGIPAPGLITWAARCVAEYVASNRTLVSELSDDALVDLLKGQPDRERNAGGRRGTKTHSLAETLLGGEEVEVPEELEMHVRQFERFVSEWQPRDVATEVTVASPTHGWAGTLDYLCELPSLPGLSLIDFKTGASGIWSEAALQQAAYASAEVVVEGSREWPMPEVERAFALWLRGDGYDLIPLAIGPEVYQHFRAALAVARRAQALKNRAYVGEALTPPAPLPLLEVVR